jgi:hypothetical protein
VTPCASCRKDVFRDVHWGSLEASDQDLLSEPVRGHSSESAPVAYIVAYISNHVARTPLLFRTRHQHKVSAQRVRDSDKRLLIRHCRPTFNAADVTLVDP